MSRTTRHVIFGTGAIGLATMEALLRRGETVRMVNRSGSAPVPEEVEVIGGDAADPRFTIDVTRGAQVIYQTLNPALVTLGGGVPGPPSRRARRREGPARTRSPPGRPRRSVTSHISCHM